MDDRVESEASPPPRSANEGAQSAHPLANQHWATASRFIALLLIVFVAKQVFLVAATYPFSGHDELAHYSYIRTLVTERRIPVLPDLTAWRAARRGGEVPPTDEIPAELYEYCRFTLDWFCQPENPTWSNNPPRVVTVPGMGFYPSGYQYVANHPPLYYATVAPVYAVASSLTPLQQHYLLRLAAIPLGLLTVYAAYRTARALFPGDAFLAVTVPAFVAFQPQISYEAAMVNNDIAAIALTSLLIWALVVGMRSQFPVKLCLIIGLLVGAGLLAKGTTMAIAPVVSLAVLLSIGWRDWRGLVVRGAAIGIPAVLLAAPWYLFLQRTYGDFSGLARVEELQYWNGPMGSFFNLLTDPDFVLGRFRETWGEFGWRLIHLSPSLLWAIAIPTIAAFIGVAIYLFAAWRGRSLLGARPEPAVASWQFKALVVLAIACVVAYLAVVQFGTSFALAQSRYFFPVVNAAAILLMLGLRTFVPLRFRPAGQGIVVAAMIALNVVIMAAYVVPFAVTFNDPILPWSWGG